MSKEDLLVDGVEVLVTAIMESKKKQAEENGLVHEETLADVLLQLAFASHHFMKMAGEDEAGDVFTTLDEMNRQCRAHMAMQIYSQANDDTEGE